MINYIFFSQPLNNNRRGEKTWEWNQREPIRSPLHALIYGIFYKLLMMIHLDYPWLVVPLLKKKKKNSVLSILYISTYTYIFFFTLLLNTN